MSSKKSGKNYKPVRQKYYDAQMRKHPFKTLFESLLKAPFLEELSFGLPIAVFFLLGGIELSLLIALISGIWFVAHHRGKHKSAKEFTKAIPTYTVQATARAFIIIFVVTNQTGLGGVITSLILTFGAHAICNAIANFRKLLAGHFG